MPTLYVANCTTQNHIFNYRVPEEDRHKIRFQRIAMGTQQMIYERDAQPEVIQKILDDNAVYGLVHVKDIDQTKKFIGLCYDFKPIPVDKILKAHLSNESAIAAQSLEARQQAAAATHKIMFDEAMKESLPLPRAVELEVEDGNPTPGEMPGSERIEIVAEGIEPRGPRSVNEVQDTRNTRNGAPRRRRK